MCLNVHRQIYKLYETPVLIAETDNWSIYSPQAFKLLKFYYHLHKFFLMNLFFSPFSNVPMGVLEFEKEEHAISGRGE